MNSDFSFYRNYLFRKLISLTMDLVYVLSLLLYQLHQLCRSFMMLLICRYSTKECNEEGSCGKYNVNTILWSPHGRLLCLAVNHSSFFSIGFW